MSERLVRVERFEELHVGMTVVDIYCGTCGRWCRGKLERLVRADEMDGPGHGDAFECVPYCGDDGDGHFNGVDRSHVNAHRIFAVVNDLESSPGTAAARVKESVKP